jgi:glycosyltransferase involved in cell wall biosynthesis
MKILVFTQEIPYPLVSGSTLRIFNIFKELSKKHSIYLFYLGTSSTNDVQVIEESGIFKECINLDVPNFLDYPLIYRTIFYILSSSKFVLLPKFKFMVIVRDKVNEIIRENDIDILHVHGSSMGLLLSEINHTPKVLDLADSPSLIYKRNLQSPKNLLDFFTSCCRFIVMRRCEKYLLKNFDLITVVSPIDGRYLKRRYRKADIQVVANGVDVNYFSPKFNIKEDQPSILFFGVMSASHNRDAAIYIHNKILPLIRSQIPNIKFYIVGANPPYEIKDLSRDGYIIVTGFVEDIREYIIKASVVLAPMRKGSGIKNKILESMSLGKAVVTNFMGAESLSPNAKKSIIIGNTTMEIAEKTIELLNNKDLRETLGKKASEVIRKEYTWKICSKRYERIYNSLLGHNRKSQ